MSEREQSTLRAAMNEMGQVDRVGDSPAVSNMERDTPWRMVKGRVHLSLPAGAGRGAARIASKQAYGRLLYRHHPSLGGVVVAHAGEVKIVAGPKYVATSPFAHVAAETTLLLFAPCVGCVLSGTVTYVGPDHLGLTVHTAFHAVLPYEDVAPHYIYTRLSDSSACWQRTLVTDAADIPSVSELDNEGIGYSNADYVIGARVRFVVTGVQTTRSGLYQLFGSVKGGSNSSASVTGELGVIHKEEAVAQPMEGPLTNQVSYPEDEQLDSVLAGLNTRKKRQRHEQGAGIPRYLSMATNTAPNPLVGNAHPLLSSNALAPLSFTPPPITAHAQRIAPSNHTPPSARVGTIPPSTPSPPRYSSPAATPPPPTSDAVPNHVPPELSSANAKTEAQIEPLGPSEGVEGGIQAKEEVPTQASVTAQITLASPGKATPASEKKRKKKRKADSITAAGGGEVKASKKSKLGISAPLTQAGSDIASGRSGKQKNEVALDGRSAAILADAVQAVKSASETQARTQDVRPQNRVEPSPKKGKSKSDRSGKSRKGEKSSKSWKSPKGVVYNDNKDEKQEQNVQGSNVASDALNNIKLSGSHSHLKREAREVTVAKEDDDDDMPGSTKKHGAEDAVDGTARDTAGESNKRHPLTKEERREKKRRKSEDGSRTDHGEGTPKSKLKKKRKDKKSRRSGNVSAVDLDRLRSSGGPSTLAHAIFEDVFDARQPN